MPRSNSLSVMDMYAHQPLPPLPAGAPLPHPAARPATVRISNDEELAAWASETQQAPNDHSYADGAAEEAPSNKDVATQANSPSDSRSGSPDFDSDPEFGSDMGTGPYMHGALGGSTLHVNEGYCKLSDDDDDELDPTERYYPDTDYRIPFLGGRSSAYCWFDKGSPYQRFATDLGTVLEVEEPPFEAESCTKPLEHLLRRVKARVSRASTLESEPAPDPVASDSAPQPLLEEAAPRDATPEPVPVQPLQRSATVTGASSHEQSQQDPDPNPIPRSRSSLDLPGAVGTNSSPRTPMASQIPRPRPVLNANARQQSQSQPAPAPEPYQSQTQPRVQQTQQVTLQPRQPALSTPARAPAPAPAPAPASRHQAPAASAPGPAPPAPARPPRPVPHSQMATTASLARSNSIRQSRTEAPASRSRGSGSSGGPGRINEQRGARQASAASSPATSGRNASGRGHRDAESSGRAHEPRGDSEDLDPEEQGRATRRGHR
ncbi:uncharacterized protein J3D65DRAFT_637044 [Phyllosticta citribraziliensis]|uniref:Uncharacterized protein n=1 Tax=Phyllosticta citribraziliensis TaxID=989973 RepID=A0ABR1LB80_9PEZI